MKAKYDCTKCPGYCCSYPVIAITKRDAERLARHLGLTQEELERRHLHAAHGRKRLLNRQKDEHYGRICGFFDTAARRCTVYAARPAVCRSFPGEGRCGYYDFLTFERAGQKDETYVSNTWHIDD